MDHNVFSFAFRSHHHQYISPHLSRKKVEQAFVSVRENLSCSFCGQHFVNSFAFLDHWIFLMFVDHTNDEKIIHGIIEISGSGGIIIMKYVELLFYEFCRNSFEKCFLTISKVFIYFFRNITKVWVEGTWSSSLMAREIKLICISRIPRYIF